MIRKHVNTIFTNFTGVGKTPKNRTPGFKKHSATRSGFTMVELGLAMAFISVLLITIAIITTNIVTIYQKGLTLKAVNSVGRGLVDELTSGINTAPSVDTTSLCNSLVDKAAYPERFNACVNEHAFDYIFHAQVSAQNEEGQTHQYNGIFCTGHYSYIWNTYYGQEEGKTIGFKYLPLGATNTDDYVEMRDFRLVRIEDKTYRLCSAVMDNQKYTSEYNEYNDSDKLIDITRLANSSSSNPLPNYIDSETGIHKDILEEFDLDLTLYELTVFPISQDSVTLRTYMSGTFVLATLRGNIDVTRSGDYCQSNQPYINPETGALEPAEDASSPFNLGSEINYCAINKFNFAARTAGSGV